MQIYLSGSVSLQGGLRRIASELESDGHAICARWLTAPLGAPDFDTPGWFERWTVVDMEDVAKADALICFNGMTWAGNGRGGKHTEFGAALALGKRVILVGERTQPFHWHPAVEFYSTWNKARAALKGA